MDSFQAKINWKMMRKREDKNCCSVSILPNHNKKIQKKFKKLKNTIMGSFRTNRLEKAEKGRK